ncbi:hypothetical protein Dimus_033626, partial [Dionaea muscipula]
AKPNPPLHYLLPFPHHWMTTPSPTTVRFPQPLLHLTAVIFVSILIWPLHALGTGSTFAAVYSTSTVCGIVADQPTRSIRCFKDNHSFPITPNISYGSIAAGKTFFCALTSGGTVILCWDTSQNDTFSPKRIYHSTSSTLSQISVGDDQVCALVNGTNRVHCWRGIKGSGVQFLDGQDKFGLVSSGLGFSCGILVTNSSVRCWGSNSSLVSLIQDQFDNVSMSTIVAGGRHVCGFHLNGTLVCRGDNSSGQLNAPAGDDQAFSQLALGLNFSCGIRDSNRSVVCWGGGGQYSSNVARGASFESIVAGLSFVCGLTSGNFSIVCWGPGWSGHGTMGVGVGVGVDLPLPMILPGPCVQSSCSCGIYPDSEKLCSGSGNICRPCSFIPKPTPSSSPPPSPTVGSSPPAKPLMKVLLSFAIIGSFAGICSIVYCLYTVFFGRKKIHNSVQPTITREGSDPGRSSSNSPPFRASTIRRQSSRMMRRQRSGTSSIKAAPERAEEFAFPELAAATHDFSLENKIGAGSFGVVYRGKLPDGREVAIKRGETGPLAKKFQEKESAFESELAFLSRLHHKHLVRLVGYCEDRDERLLVYEYMKNGALYDHLHDEKNVEKSSNVINSWKLRIKIVLDAARGIDYLHNYAVPPIIHRDIKSSNILLDENWTARVSDFGLSLMGHESVHEFRPSKAAGTVGYIDPEYYGLNVLTTKSDVYGLGVVLLELLTGKRAIFRTNDDNGGSPTTVVDFAVQAITAGELARVLDHRVGPPELNESEAVELVAYTALHCVNLEGKDRPTITDVVANLERALALCDYSHGSISTFSISLGSD